MLSRFGIYMRESNSANSVFMENLAKTIGYLKNLKHLDLDIKECHKIKREGINKVLTAIGNNQQIMSLQLRMNGCKAFNNDIATKIGALLESKIKLEYFDLSITDLKDIDQSGTADLFSGLTTQKTLKVLHLNF